MNTEGNSAVLDASVFSDLGLAEAGFFAESPESFLDTGATFPLKLGERTSFVAPIQGQAIQCYATLTSGTLTHISLHKRDHRATSKSAGNQYFQITGALREVGIDLSMVIDNQEVSIQDFLTAWVNSGLDDDKQLTVERFLAQADRLRLHYASTMPLFFYHPGVNMKNYEAFIEKVSKLGATDGISDIADPRTMQASWSLTDIEGGGLPVTKMEVGSADRSMSATKQGFENFVSAQIEHFSGVVAGRKELKAMEAEVDAIQTKIDAGKAKESDVRSKREILNDLEDTVTSMTRRACWGGTQEGHQRQADGSLKPSGTYYAVNVPSGRISVALPDGEDYTLDVWAPNSGTSTPAPTKIDTSSVSKKEATAKPKPEEDF